ncbi:DNZ54_00345 family protein [Escherichia coli]|uniref:DNZ54_00345 family protein n=1 Tax=Escherichia coli TaxID=562 RepID=UPI000DDBA395
MKKKLISGLFLMLWMALLITAMVYPQGIFPVLAASGVWVACLLTWAVIPVALAALIKNGQLWQELRASLLKTITQGGGAMSSNGIVVDAHQHTGVLKGGDTTGGPV